MKCRLLKEMEISREAGPSKALLAQCIERDGSLYAPAGTIIDDPNAHFLVKNCDAEPADNECAISSQRTPEQLVLKTAWTHDNGGFQEVQIPAIEWSKLRLERGIHPDDFEMYARGEILGYTPNGDYVPGPNWKPETANDVNEDDDEVEAVAVVSATDDGDDSDLSERRSSFYGSK